MRILVGPTESWAGSHGVTTTIPGAEYFKRPEDFLRAVEQKKPDVVLMRAAGHNSITADEVKKCPVPVIGFYHDWCCWGSERIEAVASSVDWLITEKSGYLYLKNLGYNNCSTFMLMTARKYEEAHEYYKKHVKDKKIPTQHDACFLGAFIIDGYYNPARYNPADKVEIYDNVYWSRHGFGKRSAYIDTLTSADDLDIFIGANTNKDRLKAIFTGNNISYDIIARSRIALHVDQGRKYVTHRCFETMAIGRLLFCEEVNELLDYMPKGLVIDFNKDNLTDKIRYFKDNPEEADEIAQEARLYAHQNFHHNDITKMLLKIIEDNWEGISHNARNRNMDAIESNRAPIHWAGPTNRNHKLCQEKLDKYANNNALTINERGWLEYEYYTKALNEQGYRAKWKRRGYLLKALDYFTRATTTDPENAVFLWNKAITNYQLRRYENAKKDLLQLRELVTDNDFRYNGSRVEIQIEWWMSGAIEFDLSLKKITTPPEEHMELERKGFLYRVAMVIGDNEIHWPDLPCEFRRKKQIYEALKRDPLIVPNQNHRRKVYDLQFSLPENRIQEKFL
jgi:tetratricopeptide (TPR) repeat protein